MRFSRLSSQGLLDQPQLGDGFTFQDRPMPPSCLHQVTPRVLEAISASQTYSCFEVGALVHCDLPPESESEWGLGFPLEITWAAADRTVPPDA